VALTWWHWHGGTDMVALTWWHWHGGTESPSESGEAATTDEGPQDIFACTGSGIDTAARETSKTGEGEEGSSEQGVAEEGAADQGAAEEGAAHEDAPEEGAPESVPPHWLWNESRCPRSERRGPRTGRYVAACCSVLPCVAGCCQMLQCVAEHTFQFAVLSGVAGCRSVVQSASRQVHIMSHILVSHSTYENCVGGSRPQNLYYFIISNSWIWIWMTCGGSRREEMLHLMLHFACSDSKRNWKWNFKYKRQKKENCR